MKECWYFMDNSRSSTLDLVINRGNKKKYKYKNINAFRFEISLIPFAGLKDWTKRRPDLFLARRNEICDIIWNCDWESGL